jgi:hypothetical protein
MSQIAVYLALEPQNGAAVTLARVEGTEAICSVARAAIAEARAKAAELSEARFSAIFR